MESNFTCRVIQKQFRGLNFYIRNVISISKSHKPHFGQSLKLICFLIFIAAPLLSPAQEYSLSGKVTEADEVAVPSANVILLTKDSLTVGWSLTDEGGKYHLENINPGSYVLKIKSLGYKTKTTEIIINEDIPEHIIFLEQDMLDEVVVTQPRIEQKTDRVIFNVQNTTLSNGNVWNALAKAPYLTDTGKSLLVKGNEEPLVFINDKRVYLSSGELKQLLKSTPANILKSVEVILTPPAKYDAEGRTIVNVVMSKNLSIGYNGNISGSYEQGVYPKYRFGSGHFYKTDRISLYAGHTHNIRKTYTFFSDRIGFFTDDMPSGDWLSETTEAYNRDIHNFNANIDYTINDDHSLNLSGYASFIRNRNKVIKSYTEAYDSAQQVDSSFYSVNRSPGMRDNIAVSLDYKYDIGKGKKLIANVHHTNYSYDYDQTIRTDYFGGDESLMRNNAFTNDKEQYVKIYTAQIDYTASKNKESTFETGIKWTSISFENRIDQTNIAGDNINLSDFFLYDETNFAGYVDFERNWGSWDLKLGLRAENTALKGVSVSENETNEQDYFKIFPAVSLGYKPANNHRFNFSYNKKISRPRFNLLNPFRQFLNDNNYITGNPKLLPTIDHRLNFSYNYKRSLTLNLFLNHSTNSIDQLPYVDNENNSIVYIEANLDKTIEYGINASWNTDLTPWWYFSVFPRSSAMKTTFLLLRIIMKC